MSSKKAGRINVPITERQLPPMPDTKPAIIARLEARLQAFSSVARQTDLKPHDSFYFQQRDQIVSQGAVRWATRTGRDVDEAVKEEAISLFKKDKEIAMNYQEGITIAGETIYLGDLIAETRGSLQQHKANPRI